MGSQLLISQWRTAGRFSSVISLQMNSEWQKITCNVSLNTANTNWAYKLYYLHNAQEFCSDVTNSLQLHWQSTQTRQHSKGSILHFSIKIFTVPLCISLIKTISSILYFTKNLFSMWKCTLQSELRRINIVLHKILSFALFRMTLEFTKHIYYASQSRLAS